MQETMLQPPRTIMEVFKMLPEGTLAEVIENTLYMSPTPAGQHQRTLRELMRLLDHYVKEHQLGEIFCAPLDVYLDESANAVQPDLLFIAKSNLGIFDPKGPVKGVPDLIIEILSPGNQKHDKERKKDLYERFKVKEYWIVDPHTKDTIGYQLQQERFVLIGEYVGELKSVIFNNSFIF